MSTYLPFLVLGLALGGAIAMSGVGMVVLFRATGVLNLAYGAVGAMGALIAWTFINTFYTADGLAYLAAILFGGLLTLGYGMLFGPPLAGRDPLVKAVGTVGLMLILLGAMSWIWTAQSYSIQLQTSNWSFQVGGAQVDGTQVLGLSVAIAITALVAAFLRFAKLGVAMRSLASNREITATLGVPVRRVEAAAWFGSGLLSGATGLLLADLIGLDPVTLTFLVIASLSAALIGGLRSLWVTLAAGLVIGIVQSLATSVNALSQYQAMTPFLFAIVALLVFIRSGPVAGRSLAGTGAALDVPVRRVGADRWTARPLVRTGGALAAMLLLLLAVPAAFSTYWVQVLTTTVIYSIVALGLGMLLGRVGMVSLCQIALLGVAGWVALRLGFGTHLPFLVIVLLTGLITAVAGVVVGLPALRLHGLYLALITLVAAAAITLVLQTVNFPNGGHGFLGYDATGPTDVSLGRPGVALTDVGYYRYTVIAAFVLFVLAVLHVRSRAGRAWAAIRQSQATALAVGVNVTLYKMWAFALASFVTGIAGALLAASSGGLTIFQFPVQDSITLLAVVLIAGVYSFWGAVVAAVSMELMPALLSNWGVPADILPILFGIGVLQIILTSPAGVVEQLPRDLARLGRILRHARPPGAAPAPSRDQAA
jgi:ABC-type branched-subunit amino acid transport system permease subunit